MRSLRSIGRVNRMWLLMCLVLLRSANVSDDYFYQERLVIGGGAGVVLLKEVNRSTLIFRCFYIFSINHVVDSTVGVCE